MPKMLHAVFDSHGVIIAASRTDPDDDTGIPSPIPQPGEGNNYAMITLEGAHIKMPIDQLCTTTRVDTQRKRLVSDDRRTKD